MLETNFYELKVLADGTISNRQAAGLGERPGIFEQLRMGGVGSPRMAYLGGVPALGKKVSGAAGETPFCSFERASEGLIIRLLNNRKLTAVGLCFEDLKTIDLVGHPVRIKKSRLGAGWKTVYYGELNLLTAAGDLFRAGVPTRQYVSCKKYFSSGRFLPFFRETISDKAVETDWWTALPNPFNML